MTRSYQVVMPLLIAWSVTCSCTIGHAEKSYPIVDTGQQRCYDNSREVVYPKSGDPFFGQDASYQGLKPSYRDNNDGTVTDVNTRLVWQKDPGEKKTFNDAVAGAATCRTGGYDDWRLPSIKELYSLIQFSGRDPDPESTDTSDLRPFVDTDYFDFVYGDPAKGERVIDSQMATSTKYVSTTMRGNETMFGVNFADGRIKGYPTTSPGRRAGQAKTYFVFYVRGNTEYGKNLFHDNGDQTVTDRATGLIWLQLDSGDLKAGENRDGKLNWEQAIQWCEDLEYAGHSDWRLPNVKELQSIVDYTRSPDTTQSAAIDPIFRVTPIRDGIGEVNYPFYWSGTTHVRGSGQASSASYVAFGRSQGWMSSPQGEYNLMDVHGAGSQRSDPKSGDPSQFPHGRGPQGDVIDIYNMVRPVRGGDVSVSVNGPELEPQRSGRTQGMPEQDGPMRPGDMGPSGMGPGARGMGAGGMQPGGPMGGTRPGFVSRLDQDGDGRVSRKEFDGPSDAFDLHDADNDGYLTDGEAPQGQPQGGMPGMGQGMRPGQQGMRPGMQQRSGPRAGQRPDSMMRRPLENQRSPGVGRPGQQRPMQHSMERSGTRPLSNVPSALSTPSGSESEADVDKKWSQLPPSFVFILVDDMGWTGLSTQVDDRIAQSKSDFYQTPNIDKLARQGICFSNAYSPGSMCTPSRAAILTGKSPAQLRMTTPGPSGRAQLGHKLIPPQHVDSLPEGETTIAEILKDRGYATAHFGKWHLSGGGPGLHGFDQHDGDTANGGPGAYKAPNPKDMFGITTRATEFIEKQVAEGNPFYVQLSHYAVHSPTEALEETSADYATRTPGTRHANADNAAMTHDLDTTVGIVMDKLADLGIGENVYVVFMSDNGAVAPPRRPENLPLSGGKATLWEGGIRVPLIVRGPGLPAGEYCHENVIGYDLLPTFCELAQVQTPLPSTVEGTSIVPLFLGDSGQDAFRRDQEQLVFHFPHYGMGPSQTPQSAILLNNMKLVRMLETGETRLFDLARDIGEQHDLTSQNPEQSAAMAKKLDAYLLQVDAQMPTVNPDSDSGDYRQRSTRNTPFRSRMFSGNASSRSR